MLRLPSPASPVSRPVLSRLLQESLDCQERGRLAGRVAALTDTSPVSRVPGWSTSFFGLLGGSGSMASVGSGEDEKEEEATSSIDMSQLNHDKILADAAEGIEVVSVLLKESGNPWLSGAR